MSGIDGDIYLNRVCDFLKEKKEWYLPRFGYSACELWLCSEICNILNFDHELSFHKTQSNLFCFNEDRKRDLTVYESITENKYNISSHVEVKLLYPAYSKKKVNTKLCELEKSLYRNAVRSGDNGWIFIIWTSAKTGNYKDGDSFFEEMHSNIKCWVEKNEIKYSLSEQGLIYIFGDEFDWRGIKKEIIVKAVAINHK